MPYAMLRKPAMALASIVSLAYLAYRVGFTLNLEGPYAVFASVLLLLGEVYGIASMLLYFLQIWEVSELPQQPVLPGRTVDVFVPTYNEDPQLLRGTLKACLAMDYPHRTFLLDDGKRPEVEALARELGVGYVTRTNNKHAKAGNLNNALEQTDGEFIIIFDADHVPEPHFITRLIGYFADEKLAFVQTPHAFYNFDSFQATHDGGKNTYWEEGDLFYRLIQPGKNRFHCPIFAGSAAMFRRKALAEVGYIATETITEDMHTGMRINARGWKSMAVSERLICGQAAPDVTTFHSQRLRWATGNLSILTVDNPLTMPGLSLGQRLCHFASVFHWLGGAARIPIYLTPLLMLFTGVAPVGQLTWLLVFVTLLYLLLSWGAVWLASAGRFDFWNSELFDMMSFWTKSRAALRALVEGAGQKFVVTSKRGRQSKSVWPLVRPHLAIIVVTLLALSWAWGRVAVGLSEDFYRLLLASGWAVLHMLLAFIVVRRALSPDNNRFDYRHPVNLGLGYEVKGGTAPRRLAVTVDLCEGGLGLLTTEPVPTGSVLAIDLHGPGEELRCQGKVTWSDPLLSSRLPLQCYRVGVVLEDLTADQRDTLQRLGMHFAVSRQYEMVAEGNASAGLAGLPGRWLGRMRARLSASFDFRLPVTLEVPGAAPRELVVSTEHVSREDMSVLLAEPLPAGAEPPFVISTPLGDIRGTAKLARQEKRRLGGFDYHLATLSFARFTDQGRGVLSALTNRKEHRPLLRVLSPRREVMRLPLIKPLAAAAFLALPLLGAQGWAFWKLQRPDLALHAVAVTAKPTPAQRDEVRRIHAATEKQARPTVDRLVLLRRAWQKLGNTPQVERLTRLLAERDPTNIDLQIALIDVLVKHREFDKAPEIFERFAGTLDYALLRAARKKEVLVVVARACLHGGSADKAAAFFAQAVEQAPVEPELRNEYAGVLLQVGQPEAVLPLYGEEEGVDAEGRFLLASAHRRLGDNAAAERECRQLALERPSDLKVQLLLAETLQATGRQGEAQRIFDRVSQQDPTNDELRKRLAFWELSNHKYAEALERFRALLQQDADQPDLVRAFVDAAAGAETLGAADGAVLLKVYEQALKEEKDDRVFLDRLAWVLQKTKDYERSLKLLERLHTGEKEDRALQLRIATCLLALGKTSEVLVAVDKLGNDPEAARLRAGVLLRVGDAEGAEKACRQVLARTPADPEALSLLAAILTTRKQYAKAEGVYLELLKLTPNDKTIPVRLAELSLWAGHYAVALGRYETLLSASPDQPPLWAGFADAAAGVQKLGPSQRKAAAALAEKLHAAGTKNATVLTRLAGALVRSGSDATLTHPLLERAVALAPKEDDLRKELAGVLVQAEMYKEALAMYEGLKLTLAEEISLVGIHLVAKDAAGAEKRLRELLAAHPNDRGVRRQLGDVLAWSKSYDAAAKVYRELLKDAPDDDALQVRLAQVSLWAEKHDEALVLFRAALARDPGQTKLYRDYIDAAAMAKNLGRADKGVVARLAAWAKDDVAADPVVVARLAWVCGRLKQTALSVSLLEKAVALQPANKKLRVQLADALYGQGSYREAERHYLIAAKKSTVME
jgi:cellulose synthase/poly-beta-1,6-N-acetylglucosamine synthase-like glycosyltransferase/tetratricopeptide (TPR) repeat protein